MPAASRPLPLPYTDWSTYLCLLLPVHRPCSAQDLLGRQPRKFELDCWFTHLDFDRSAVMGIEEYFKVGLGGRWGCWEGPAFSGQPWCAYKEAP